MPDMSQEYEKSSIIDPKSENKEIHMMDPSVTAVVLAAGKGTRMQAPAEMNKVTYKLVDKPMIAHTREMLEKAGFNNIVVVVGYASESVRQALGDSVTYAIQENPKGTGHALQCALPSLLPECSTVICMSGDDSAFYTPSLMEQLYQEHTSNDADVTMVTVHKDDPTGLGRIVRDEAGQVTAIIEEKNASDAQRQIKEINTALYCFNRSFLDETINQIKPNSVSGELYLTDMVEIAINNQQKVHALAWDKDDIWHGINTPEQLQEAEMHMKQKSAVK